MKDNIRNVHDDSIDTDMLEDLQKMLDEEMSKPENEIDFNKVAEITEAIAEISGAEDIPEETIEIRAEEIISEANVRERRKGINILYKWVSVLSACFVFAIALNFYTVSSYGTDLITTVMEITENGFSLDFSNEVPIDKPVSTSTNSEKVTTEIALTTTSNVPAIIAESTSSTQEDNISATIIVFCTTTGVYHTQTMSAGTTTIAWFTRTTPVEETDISEISTTAVTVTEEVIATTSHVPSSYGEGFEGKYIREISEQYGIKSAYPDTFIEEFILSDYISDETELSKDIYFTLIGIDDSVINISAEQYNKKEDIPSVLVPSESLNGHAESINLGNVYFFNEDDFNRAVFVYENTVYTITGYGDAGKSKVYELPYVFVPYSEN